VNLFNNDINYILIYEEFVDRKKITKIKIMQFQNCLNIEPIILSNETKKEISFNKSDYYIIFSLDENIKLYKNSEIISPNRNNEIFLDYKDIKFYFTKSENEKSGIFINYYCFL
jgi:hypothetical protein